jgi:hypothetical protein
LAFDIANGIFFVNTRQKETHTKRCAFLFGETLLSRFEDHKCNSPVDCRRRRLDGGEYLFLPTAKMQTNLAGTSRKNSLR